MSDFRNPLNSAQDSAQGNVQSDVQSDAVAADDAAQTAQSAQEQASHREAAETIEPATETAASPVPEAAPEATIADIAEEVAPAPKKKGWFSRDDRDEKALQALRARVAELEQDLLYAKAEVQNARRRADKEIAAARDYAATGFARDMLQVADNIARAQAALSEAQRADSELQSFLVGIAATERELQSIYERHGVSRIAAVGLPLDPNLHQAMFEVETSEVEAGVVVQEMQAGYMIKERLLRPALVGVAKAPESAPQAQADTAPAAPEQAESVPTADSTDSQPTESDSTSTSQPQ